MAATDSSYGSYLWVSISNGAFVLPVVYLIAYTDVRKTAIHLFLTLCILFASATYHACDRPAAADYGGNCIIPFANLQEIDFSLSVLVAVNALTYNLPVSLVWVREISVAMTLVVMAYFFGAYSTLNERAYYIYFALLSLLLFATRARYSLLSVSWPAVVTFVVFGLAFLFFGLDSAYYYQDLHGVWHVLAAVGLLCAFYWFDHLDQWPLYTLDRDRIPLLAAYKKKMGA